MPELRTWRRALKLPTKVKANIKKFASRGRERRLVLELRVRLACIQSSALDRYDERLAAAHSPSDFWSAASVAPIDMRLVARRFERKENIHPISSLMRMNYTALLYRNCMELPSYREKFQSGEALYLVVTGKNHTAVVEIVRSFASLGEVTDIGFYRNCRKTSNTEIVNILVECGFDVASFLKKCQTRSSWLGQLIREIGENGEGKHTLLEEAFANLEGRQAFD